MLAESMTQPGWDLRIVDEHGAAVGTCSSKHRWCGPFRTALNATDISGIGHG